jgi:hypothetical protein
MAGKAILRPMQVRIPDAARNWLKAQARAADRSVNWVINQMLDRAQKEQTHG